MLRKSDLVTEEQFKQVANINDRTFMKFRQIGLIPQWILAIGDKPVSTYYSRRNARIIHVMPSLAGKARRNVHELFKAASAQIEAESR